MTTKKELNAYIRQRLGVPDDPPRIAPEKPYACQYDANRRHDHICYCKPPVDAVCRYCGHPKSRHDVAAPSTDNWRICYDCPTYSHVFEPRKVQ